MSSRSSKSTGTLADTNLGTTYLKLEPIKEELSITTSLDLTGSENYTTDADGVPLTDHWIITSGNTSFSGLTNGVLIQFCEYNPKTKLEKELFYTDFQVASSSVITKTFTFATDDYNLYTKFRGMFGKLSRRLKVSSSNKTFDEDVKPYLKVYALPANYVTKQINISSIQGYWQDPTFSNVMWIQHTACCSFTTGPFSPTVVSDESGPTAITQGELKSKAATGTEVFHNIIPYLDTIMTYAN
tara:strand:- start:315 stop:1040 length:726 start_codon:yes stop_codon:yes gene_type:complete